MPFNSMFGPWSTQNTCSSPKEGFGFACKTQFFNETFNTKTWENYNLLWYKYNFFLWKINHLHLVITWAMQRETAHWKKSTCKRALQVPLISSPSPKPNLTIYCLLGEKLSALKCKPHNLQQLISPCKTMEKAVCLTSSAGREWLGMRGDLPVLPAAGVSEPAISDRLALPVIGQGSHGRAAFWRRKDFLGMGHVPEKFCSMEAGHSRVWSGTITLGIAEIWSLHSLCILVYRSLWLTDKISCLGEKHNKIKPWQGMSL